ncbi:LON peptidase substrate-binding domain-containing protein [Telmatospirillum sp. J64-1]|uniref:LON peptidase substrate-binding domain-containing protein n=1 Tax=Telmatospirillum sp. J64-1 TaxID=2502183 RepID=UPI00115F243D|nr:LON peptidase substrate-binding domain-containing protein [Telmatospirillum sp. J64-1]
MSAPAHDPFLPQFQDLPGELPIFPLEGALLLPRGRLPLNIFEPRYLAMTLDALRHPQRLIGMIQPTAPERSDQVQPVYSVGCAGRISAFEETADGRLLIVLTGVARFRLAEELPQAEGGYRRVRPDFSEYADDLETLAATGFSRDQLVKMLKPYLHRVGMKVDWQVIDSASDLALVTTLAMICPFEPKEKQALLEAPTLAERASAMVTLMEMALAGGPAGNMPQ